MNDRALKTNVSRIVGGHRARRKRRLVLGAGILVSAAILSYLVFRNLNAIRRVSDDIRWGWVWAAVGCALGSYAMVGLALGEVLGLLGHVLSFAEVFGIAFVSTTANYFVSTAGVSGFALKAHLLRKRQVPYGITLTASVLSSAILYIVLAVIIAQGMVYLVLRLQGSRIAVLESAVGLLILLAVTVPLLVLFFNERARSKLTRKAFHWANRGAFFFSKSEIPREDFEEFEEQLARGLEAVRNGKGELTRTIIYTCGDWVLSMMTLYLAFRAVGLKLPIGHLTAGFTAGMAATLIPVLPGGLGVVEGSMAAIFESLGIDWGKALVAVLLYRMAYYVIPGLISVFILWGLKVSEPAIIEDTVRESMPEELRLRALELERRKTRKPQP